MYFIMRIVVEGSLHTLLIFDKLNLLVNMDSVRKKLLLVFFEITDITNILYSTFSARMCLISSIEGENRGALCLVLYVVGEKR